MRGLGDWQPGRRPQTRAQIYAPSTSAILSSPQRCSARPPRVSPLSLPLSSSSFPDAVRLRLLDSLTRSSSSKPTRRPYS